MKRFLSFLFTILISNLSSYSQGIYQLWGMNTQGGSDDLGTIFTIDYQARNLKTRYNFKREVPGHNPAYIQLREFSGKYYGMTSSGGAYNSGVIFEWDPQTNIYTKKHDFDQLNGFEPLGNLTLEDGIFYGMTSRGGLNDFGTIFKWNPAMSDFAKMQDLTSDIGTTPYGGLSMKDGKMYGIGFRGGSQGWGTIFEWDPKLNIIIKKLDLSPGIGVESYGEMTLKDGKFYGMFENGGKGYGVIFEWDPGTNEYVIKIEFTSATGVNPYGGLTYYEGEFYGVTSGGGENGSGTIFSWDPVLNTFTKKFDFSSASGSFALGSLTLNSGIFYGLTSQGGENDIGTLFSWNPETEEFLKLKDFSRKEGANPKGSLSIRNGKLAGVTYNGGANNFGAIFEFDISTKQFTRKLSFDDREGKGPTGKLSFLNNKFYGVTSAGGVNNEGTIFEFDPLSGAYSRKFNFDGEKGVTPYYGMVQRNGKFYGVTSYGGNENYGAIFEWDPISNNYTKKHDFNYTDGACPLGLVEWHDKFYGVTSCGGENATGSSLGVIFEWDPEKDIFTKKINFEIATGYSPRGVFTLKNDKLYGITSSGGPLGYGVVYEWDPGSNQYKNKSSWQTGLGYPGLTAVGDSFYGSEYFGGTSGGGTIFEWNWENNTVKTSYNFDYNSGSQSMTNLTELNGKLYGTTNYGGKYGKGTIFELQPSSQIYSKLVDLDESTGYTFFLGDLTPFPAMVSKGINNTCVVNSVTITSSNNNLWAPIIDSNGDAIAEIYANGNNLGKVDVSLYLNSGPVREDSRRQLYLDRNVTVTPENKVLKPGTSVDVRFYIRKNEFDALVAASNSTGAAPEITDISHIGLFKSSDSFCHTSVQQTASAIASNISAWNQDYVFTASVQSFSTFYFASNSYSALPVKLVKLTADVEEQSGVIRWQTAEEQNLSYFEIERSEDGKIFTILGKVDYTERDNFNNYTFLDAHILELGSDKAYYRLKMVDSDGRFAYSFLVSLSLPFSEISIHPNPASNTLNVKLRNPDDTSWHIVNAEGRKLLAGKSTVQNFAIDLKKINSGIYHLVLASGQLTKAIKFFKN